MAVQVDKTKFQDRIGRPRIYTVNWVTDSEEEAETGIPQTFRGLPFTQANAVQWHPGSERFVVVANYEGLLEDPSPDLDQFSIDGEFREEKIESFPVRKLLEETYGAQIINKRLEFPPTLPNRRRPPGRGGYREKVEPNPLFNVRTYPVFYETAVWSFVRKNVPSWVNSIVGSVEDSLPSGFEYDGDALQWFCTKAPRVKRGGSWSISIHYKEIDEMKHIGALQDLISQSNGESGSGLSTGSL